MFLRSSVTVCVGIGLLILLPSAVEAQLVRFDAPAYVECLDACDPQFDQTHSSQRLICVPLEIAADIHVGQEDEIAMLVLQIAATDRNTTLYDFAPRNISDSDIEGTISVERSHEQTATLGFKADATPSFATTSAEAGLSGKNGEITRFQRKPPQDLAVASGFFARQSGVFFKLHRTSQRSLEGTHAVSLILRVPRHWRTGLLRLQTTSLRTKSNMFGERNLTVDSQATFMLPIFLTGDDEARRYATAYESAEIQFRRLANDAIQRDVQPDLADQLKTIFVPSSSEKIDRQWLERMLVSQDPAIADQFHLPRSLSVALKDFQRQKQIFIRLSSLDERSVSTK